MATSIALPEMGEGVIEGTLARWLVSVGDRVDRYAPIAEVETDKVTTETTTDTAGTILRLCVREGETVPVGTVLAYVGEPGEVVPENGEQPATDVAAPITPVPDREQSVAPDAPSSVYTGRISPIVGRIAAEHQVDLNQIVGTGREGRITKQDILAYLSARDTGELPQQAAAPSLPPPAALPVAPMETVAPESAPVRAEPAIDGDLVALTGIRRAIAEHMVRSKHTSPHVTTVFEFDFSAVAAHRRAHKEAFLRDGTRLTYTAYIVAATVQALKAHPMVNSTWTDDGIRLLREINIGMATAIDDGLIVPVIRNADGMNLLGLARTINDLADRARAKQLRPDEVRGGTFSITNHGTSGSLFATPIINQPQCGILGVGAVEKRVKVIDDAIAIRPLAYVSFTFDHRILDGASADAFVSTVKRHIENWR